MVVVSHLFLFLWKNFRADLTRMSQICPCLELSISRQPLFCSILPVQIFHELHLSHVLHHLH